MKGVIFNLLERTTSERHGELFWERVLEEAGASGAYTSLGNYETEELVRIVTAIAAGTGTDADSVVRQFGRDAIPIFSRLYPQFFSPHTELIPFLLTLNEIIHPEVRKLYPDAEVPHFSYESSDEDLLIMGYASGRGLCALGEGLIAGAADHYGVQAEISQPRCSKRGDSRCVFEVATPR